MIPAISNGGRMHGLVAYLAGDGKANEHTNQRAVAASSPEVYLAAGSGQKMIAGDVRELASTLDEARLVFGTEVTRRDKAAMKAAFDRGLDARGAIAEATRDENVWHCSLSVSADELAARGVTELDDATWSEIAHEFMEKMGFDAPDHAPARWVAIHHGKSTAGNDHIHIAASRVRDDGTVVKLWQPHPHRSGQEGDWPRAQRVVREIAAKHDLRVVGGTDKDTPTRGTHHAQTAHAEREGLAEAPRDELSRRVRAAATAAESEAEFVRLVRADGLLIQPAHYDAGDPEAVTGYSVAFPTSRYSNRHGQPVFHGAKKRLGEDLSLPRLREFWPEDDRARADAQSAWTHAESELPPRRSNPHTQDRVEPAEQQARTDKHTQQTHRRECSAQLGDIVRPIAAASHSEADYVRALRAHPEIVVRPRYAKGTTTEVSGYVLALRSPQMAGADGKPVWCSASYIDGLALSDLRTQWPTPSADQHRETLNAWKQPTRTRSNPTHRGNGRSTDHATSWQRKVDGITNPTSPAWNTAAADTAAAVSAAAARSTGADRAALSHLADKLAGAAGQRRPSRAPNSRHRNAAIRRVTAVMLASQSSSDTSVLWIAVMQQLLATSRAISAAMAAQGRTQQAAQLYAAANTVQHHFPTTQPGNATAPEAETATERAARMARRGTSSATPSATTATPTRRSVDQSTARDSGISR